MRRATDRLTFAFVIATWLAAPHVARAQTLTVFSSAYLGSNSTTSVMIGAEVNGLAPAPVEANGRPREIDVRIAADAPTLEDRTIAVRLSDAATLERAVRGGVRMLARMTLPPGRHAIRVEVHDSAGVNGGTSTVHIIDVPNLVDGPITMSHLAMSSS